MEFTKIIKEDKYLLPALNWALFTAISAVMLLYFVGLVWGIASTILSALFIGPLKNLAPNTFKYIVDQFKDLEMTTHLGLFIVQLIILLFVLYNEKIREKLWQTLKKLISEN